MVTPCIAPPKTYCGAKARLLLGLCITHKQAWRRAEPPLCR